MNIEVGDRVTYKSGKDQRQVIMTNEEQIENYESNVLIIKIERIGINGWYTVYEKEDKKELLTNEEKEFLKHYIKILENLDNGKAIYIYREEEKIVVCLDTDLAYYIEVGKKFGNMNINTTYTLLELGLED